jgi:RNA polymerase sigma-70 factor (ECF subfamily)
MAHVLAKGHHYRRGWLRSSLSESSRLSHPAIGPPMQIALKLLEMQGLTNDVIAFLTLPATMAQQVGWGKAKICDATISVVIPQADELSERFDSVVNVIHLVFSEGYSTSSCELLPDSKAVGLLALMLLHECRRARRNDRKRRRGCAALEKHPLADRALSRYIRSTSRDHGRKKN